MAASPDPIHAELDALALVAGRARVTLGLRRPSSPVALLLEADAEALPLRRCSLTGARVRLSSAHVPDSRLPLALADLHRALAPGAPVELRRTGEAHLGAPPPPPDERPRLLDVVTGAGFTVEGGEPHLEAVQPGAALRATRGRTLADTVGPGMRLLVCGLNPSILSADVGVGFARPGNRFWGAAVAAGAASRVRDPLHALHHHGTGMTDIVKRATVGAAELDPAEYRSGIGRVERLCAWLRPGAICFVGLAGWRAAIDRRAVPGVQPDPFGGVPAYVMPSTSGLNAHTKPADHAEHLRAALSLAERG